MKKILFLSLLSISFFSCEEKGPDINFGNLVSTDSSYMAPIETTEARRVLVEEFTGAACPNCPAAREQLAIISNANPGKVIILGIHVFGIPQSAPVHGLGVYDFRTQKGTDILNTVYGNVIGIPIAGIDRVPVGGALALSRVLWNQTIADRLNAAPPVNLSVESNYNSSTGNTNITVIVAYTQDVEYAHSLGLLVLEDSIVDAQDYPTYVDTFYTFKHVLRDYITSISGKIILPEMPVKQSGLVYKTTLNFQVPVTWVPKNCQIVAYIQRIDGLSKEILQAAETHMTK